MNLLGFNLLICKTKQVEIQTFELHILPFLIKMHIKQIFVI